MQADRAALKLSFGAETGGEGSAGRAKMTAAVLGSQEWLGGNVADDTSRLKTPGENDKVERPSVTPFRQSISLSDGLVFVSML